MKRDQPKKEMRMAYSFGRGDEMGRPTAVVSLYLDDGIHGEPLLGGLLVVESERRKGLASAIIGEAETWLSERGYRRVFAVTHPDNEAAIALMKSRGFKPMILWEKPLVTAQNSTAISLERSGP